MREEKIKILRMLKALDDPVRRRIVEFILNQKSESLTKGEDTTYDVKKMDICSKNM